MVIFKYCKIVVVQAIIVFLLVLYAISNAAEQPAAPPLSIEAKQEVGGLVEEKLKNYKENLNAAVDHEKWLWGGMLTILGLAMVAQGWNAYAANKLIQETRKEIDNTIEKANKLWMDTEKKIDLTFEKQKREFHKIIAEEELKAQKEFSSLAQLQRDQQLLTKRVSDFDEPFIIHSVDDENKAVIVDYLKKVECLNNMKLGENAFSYYDFEIIANAHHYLAGAKNLECEKKDEHKGKAESKNSNCEACRNEHKEKAIEYYNKALRKIGDIYKDTKVNALNYKLKRNLANALSATGDYLSAIDLYKEIIDSEFKSETAHVYLSWGDALKGIEDFKDAMAKYAKATEELLKREINLFSKNEHNIFIQSLYQQANTQTEQQKYSEADASYDKAVQHAKKFGMSPEWLYMSYGDLKRKSGDYDSALYYYDLELKEPNDNKETYYRKGQALIGNAVKKENDDKRKEAQKLFQDACYEFNKVSDKYKTAVFWAYLGYALMHNDNSNEKQAKEYFEKAIEKQKAIIINKKTTCRQKYDMAVCYAMGKDAINALYWLKEAIKENNVALIWAKESYSLDFVAILGDYRFKQEFDEIVNVI